jgi:hypothetical protein
MPITMGRCESGAHGTCIGGLLPGIERVLIDQVKLPITDVSRPFYTKAFAPFGR